MTPDDALCGTGEGRARVLAESTEKRFYVYDRKSSQAGGLVRISATNPRYWIMDRESGQAVDEATLKSTATAIARDLNKEA